MEDLRARGMGALHIRRRITPEEREDRNTLFQTDSHMVLDGEVEDEIDTERPVSKLPDAANDLTKERRRVKLCLQDAEAARVAHRRDELRTGQVGPHRRGDDRVLDPQQVAERGFHGHPKGLTDRYFTGASNHQVGAGEVVFRDARVCAVVHGGKPRSIGLPRRS